MKTPHKHAELIKAWADGAEIEVYWNGKWEETASPVWNTQAEYRIKPDPKPDVVLYAVATLNPKDKNYAFLSNAMSERKRADNIRLTFDGETSNLKKAEVLE